MSVHAAHGGIAAHSIGQLVVSAPQDRQPAATDRPRPVADWTARQLGVHPAIHGSAHVDAPDGFVLPEYLERDHDRAVRDHLSGAATRDRTTFVLIRGSSCTGKTRTAFEAVHSCLPDWQLVFPKSAGRLLALLDADALAPRTVLWIDEAQNLFTGTDGEQAAAALRSRLEQPGPIVAIGTLWPEYHRALTRSAPPGAVADERAHARALLHQAALVDVPLSFDPQVLKGLRDRVHDPLRIAARTGTDGRITQVLAAGPQLVDHYQQAVPPHGPYGHAVITAAMDARRLGHSSPLLPAALLKAAAVGYLTEEQRAAADGDTWFAGALEYAREKVMGVAAALEPVADPEGVGALPDVYRLNDYLDNHARTAGGRLAFPPDSFWTAVRNQVTDPRDLKALAERARTAFRFRIAAELYRIPADLGDPYALRPLALLRERAGETAEAVLLWQRLADAGDPEARLAEREGYPALTHLAFLSELAGDKEAAERFAERSDDYVALRELAWEREGAGEAEAAERLAQQAADAGAVAVVQAMARSREESGDAAGVERLYRRVAAFGTARALGKLAGLLATSGDPQGAERLWQQAVDAGNSGAMVEVARMREQAGDLDAAGLLIRRAAALGNGTALAELAEQQESAGNAEVAELLWRHAADAGCDRALENLALLSWRAGDADASERAWQRAADGRTDRDVETLVRRRAGAGDVDGAARMWRRAFPGRPVGAGMNPERPWEEAPESEETAAARREEYLRRQAAERDSIGALHKRAQHLEKAGNPGGAERIWQQAADRGNTYALASLARLREWAGDREGAERLARQALSSGDPTAVNTLARLRERAGDLTGLGRLCLPADDIDSPMVLVSLAAIHESAGDADGAGRLLERAARAGDSAALVELARRCERAGDAEGAERLAWLAAAAGNVGMLAELARLRERSGDRASAERLWWWAADTGLRTALREMVELHERAGDEATADRLWRHGLPADPSTTSPWLWRVPAHWRRPGTL